MKRLQLFLVVLAALVSAVVASAYLPAARLGDAEIAVSTVTRGPLEVWAHYTGELQAESALLVSAMPGGGTLIELAPEGRPVRAGELLARFDATALQRELLQLEQEHALALAELEGLQMATLPLERAALEAAAAAARNAWQREQRFIAEAEALFREGLLSAGELDGLRETVAELRATMDNRGAELDLTVRYLHPSRLRQQQARVDAAARALEQARARFAATEVRAPADGLVLYRMLQIGAEFRSARVGDTLAANQPFMLLPDLAQLVVHCNVAESELANVQPGNVARLHAHAFPALELEGRVLRVGAVAQSVPGRPSWQRFFPVEIRVLQARDELRPGMSVNVDVLAYRNPDAVLIERAAVRWDNGRATGEFDGLFSAGQRELVLGRANARHFEVLSGAEPGERVLLP